MSDFRIARMCGSHHPKNTLRAAAVLQSFETLPLHAIACAHTRAHGDLRCDLVSSARSPAPPPPGHLEALRIARARLEQADYTVIAEFLSPCSDASVEARQATAASSRDRVLVWAPRVNIVLRASLSLPPSLYALVPTE